MRFYGKPPFKTSSASGVIIFYFLKRYHGREIIGLLKTGGVLVYETFLKRQNTIDQYRNPDFLLEDGELLSYFKNLELLFTKKPY